MSTKLKVFDVNRIAIEGQPSPIFRKNASYSWSIFRENILLQNKITDEIEEVALDIDKKYKNIIKIDNQICTKASEAEDKMDNTKKDILSLISTQEDSLLNVNKNIDAKLIDINEKFDKIVTQSLPKEATYNTKTLDEKFNNLKLSDIQETEEYKHFTKDSIAGLMNALSNKADKSQVQKNVPADAKFTDTNTHRAISESLNSTRKEVSASSNAIRIVDNKVLDASNAAAEALAEAKKKVEKDSAGDITVRLIRSIYGTQSSISSTADICFRNKSDGDNYMRFVTQAGFLNWLIAGGAKLTDTNTHRAISNSTSSSSQSTSASSYAVKIAYDKANAAAKKANDAYNRANKPGFSLYTQTTGSGPGKRTAPSGYQFLCMSAPSIRQSVHVTKISRNGKEITIFTLDARAIWTIIWAK